MKLSAPTWGRDLWEARNDQERFIGVVDELIRAIEDAVNNIDAEIVYSQDGAISATPSPKYTARRRMRLKRLYVDLTTAGSTTTIVVVKVYNGSTTTTVATVNLISSDTEESTTTFTPATIEPGYKVWIEVTAAGTGAQKLGAVLEYDYI